MQGMDAPMMANMPQECADVMTSEQTEAMPADAQQVAGADDGGMGAMGAMDAALADPTQDAPAPMDATADAALTAMDAGAVAGSSPSAGMDEQAAAAADTAATEEVADDAPVVDEVDPNAGMA